MRERMSGHPRGEELAWDGTKGMLLIGCLAAGTGTLLGIGSEEIIVEAAALGAAGTILGLIFGICFGRDFKLRQK